jgi:hypothetical protein
MSNGMIRWSTRHAVCGIIVCANRVVDCAPYVRRWAIGRDARELWREQARRTGVQLEWFPDEVSSQT